MKALYKYLHLPLLVAVLMATTGFRVSTVHCASGKSNVSVSLSSEPGCCCSKKKAKVPEKTCNDISCVMQRSVASQSNISSTTQQVAKVLKEPSSYPSFTETIRPAILETIPHVTLPPPMSGRDIGILHQTFLI